MKPNLPRKMPLVTLAVAVCQKSTASAELLVMQHHPIVPIRPFWSNYICPEWVRQFVSSDIDDDARCSRIGEAN
ncbi:hypothetical protein CEXT_692321 [Caerostris extrusa]|uniref:Secreted protein n=1 Tax=Caerostris extrusa TaxID=172846 RepID=A0AAV4W4Q1_CAEEX|nr:hypothetical protein CEXT_692321 [Caerostris extrusa]